MMSLIKEGKKSSRLQMHCRCIMKRLGRMVASAQRRAENSEAGLGGGCSTGKNLSETPA